jgi:UDP-glucose 4-epimerase
MAILVSGGAGYIGSHMVLELLDAGEKPVVLDNLSTGHRWAVAAEAPLIVGDIGDRALVESLIKEHQVEAIIHFAGSIVVSDSVADPLGYHLNNTVRSHALIEAAQQAGVRSFIFSSSAAVYGMPAVNPVAEDARPEPISPYGSSKLMTEMMLRETAAAHDFRYVALRYFNVAGADEKGRAGESRAHATHLVEICSQVAMGERPGLKIFGDDYDTPDGTCVRDYIHVTDLARAHLSALEHLRDGGDSLVLNCGYGRGFSVREVVEAFKAANGVDFAVEIAPRRPGDPASLVARADRIRAELGWQPMFDDLHLITRQAYDWEKHLVASGRKAEL